jgi:hypothetical protein
VSEKIMSMKGQHHTRATKRRMSLAKRGRTFTKKHRAAISRALRAIVAQGWLPAEHRGPDYSWKREEAS